MIIIIIVILLSFWVLAYSSFTNILSKPCKLQYDNMVFILQRAKYNMWLSMIKLQVNLVL